jgi:hypothetical protein
MRWCWIESGTFSFIVTGHSNYLDSVTHFLRIKLMPWSSREEAVFRLTMVALPYILDRTC